MEDFWQTIFSILPFHLPHILIYVAGMVLCMLCRASYKPAARRMLAGLTLCLIGMIGSGIVTGATTVMLSGGHGYDSVRQLQTINLIFTSFLPLAGMSLIIAAFMSAMTSGQANANEPAYRTRGIRRAFVLGIIGICLFSPLGILAWSMSADLSRDGADENADPADVKRLRITKWLGVMATVFLCIQAIGSVVLLSHPYH